MRYAAEKKRTSGTNRSAAVEYSSSVVRVVVDQEQKLEPWDVVISGLIGFRGQSGVDNDIDMQSMVW